jgi:hypothetical protein
LLWSLGRTHGGICDEGAIRFRNDGIDIRHGGTRAAPGGRGLG